MHLWVLNLKDGPLVELILKYILCCIFYLTFKYMIYLNFLALHAQGFHGHDTKIERGKHVIVGLQERKIPASQKEIIWPYCCGGSCRNSFLLAKNRAVNENKF